MYTSLNTGLLYVDFVYFARRQSSIPRTERVIGAANNISDRSEAKGTGILSDTCVKSR